MENTTKILVVSAPTENCDVHTMILDEYEDIFSLVKEDIESIAPLHADKSDEIIGQLKETAWFDDDNEHEAITLSYRKNGSIFGTDEIIFKYWSIDDILNRIAIAYIVMA